MDVVETEVEVERLVLVVLRLVEVDWLVEVVEIEVEVDWLVLVVETEVLVELEVVLVVVEVDVVGAATVPPPKSSMASPLGSPLIAAATLPAAP